MQIRVQNKRKSVRKSRYDGDVPVILAATSRDVWTALHTSFASQSQARAHAIRTALGEVKLHDLTITDYFNKVKGMADTLASIGKALGP